MSISQVKEAEHVANEVIKKNEEVYAKEVALPYAKAIKGLRAVFGEVCMYIYIFSFDIFNIKCCS